MWCLSAWALCYKAASEHDFKTLIHCARKMHVCLIVALENKKGKSLLSVLDLASLVEKENVTLWM